MKLTTAGIMRNTLPLAVITVATTMLILSACGGGGSGGGGGVTTTQMGGSRQGVALLLTPTVSTFAGLSSLNTNADGTGGAASFKAPLASVSDGTNLYIADSANNTIRKVVILTGEVTTLAGSSVAAAGLLNGTGTATKFHTPSGIATDGINLYIADTGNNVIREISPSSGVLLKDMTSANAVVSTLAGTSISGSTSNTTGNLAKFSGPIGIATDGINLYVADTGNASIRKIAAASGVVVSLSTMASATAAVSTLDDGTIRGHWFATPVGITTDKNSLFVTDSGCNDITTISPTSGVKLIDMTSSTKAANIELAGNCNAAAGANDGLATNATFDNPYGIATDNTYLYVADVNNNKVRRIEIAGLNAGNTISLTGTHIANAAANAGYADGAAANASFSGPAGIVVDNNNLYVMDKVNNTIRKITPEAGANLSSMISPIVSTFAGVSPYNNPADGTGMAARLGKTQYSTSDGTNLYVTECGPNAAVIRKVVIATGVTTTLAGSAVSATPVDATGTAASFNCPQGITTDGTNLYVTDSADNTVRMISASGVNATLSAMTSANAVVTTLVGTGTLSAPYGITTDGINLYVADSGNNTIRKIAASGVGATLSNLTSASAVVTSITIASTTVGVADGVPAAVASFNAPYSITTNGKNLFVADRSNNKIRMIAPTGGATLGNISAASAVVSSITGASGVAVTAGFDNGITAASAAFNLPGDITTDGINLYVVDFNNNRIRMIAPTGGATLANISAASAVVSSITGASGVTGVGVLGYADGPGAAATFNGPTGITTDGVSLYVTDSTNGTIRKIR